MATTTLRPDSTIATTGSVDQTGAATDLHSPINEVSANDTTYTHTTHGSANASVELGLNNLPADAANTPITGAGNITYTFRTRHFIARANDNVVLLAQILDTNGVALTDQVTVDTYNAGGETAFSDKTGSFTVNATGLAASLATWNDAKLRFDWSYTKNAGPDGIDIDISQAFLNVTYAASQQQALLESSVPVSAVAAPAPLTAQITFADAETATVTDNVALTAQITLIGVESASVTDTGAITTQITFATQETATVGYNADLLAPQVPLLDAAANAAVTDSSTLSAVIQFVGAESVGVTSVSNLTAIVQLAAVASATVTDSGAITTTITLAGAESATVTDSVTISTPAVFDAADSASVTSTAALTTEILLTAVGLAVVTKAASLTAGGTLDAAGTATVTPSANLTANITLQAVESASISATGDLSNQIQLAVSDNVSAIATVNLTAVSTLEAAGATSIIANADLLAVITLNGVEASSVAYSSGITTSILFHTNGLVIITPAVDLTTVNFIPMERLVDSRVVNLESPNWYESKTVGERVRTRLLEAGEPIVREIKK